MGLCPQCNKETNSAYTFCPHCGKPLARPSGRWYFRNYSLVVGFLMFGPFVLPLVWLNPDFSWTKKLIVTVIMLGVTWLLVLSLRGLVLKYFAIYDQLLN